MIAIYKRELKSYFQTVIGWLFIAAVIALYGLYFLHTICVQDIRIFHIPFRQSVLLC